MGTLGSAAPGPALAVDANGARLEGQRISWLVADAAIHLVVAPASLTPGPFEFTALSVRPADDEGNPALCPRSEVRSVPYVSPWWSGFLPYDVSPDGRWIVIQRNGFELVSLESGLRLPLAFTVGLGAPAWRP